MIVNSKSYLLLTRVSKIVTTQHLPACALNLTRLYGQALTKENALPYEKIPGPPAKPGEGVMHHFGKGGRYEGLDLEKLTIKLYEEFGDIVSVKGSPGKPDSVYLFNFEDIEKVYRTEGPWPVRPNIESREHYLKEKRPDLFKSVGLFHAQGKDWHDIRSKVNQPMMQTKVTKQYIGWIEEITNDFITRLMLFGLDGQGNATEDFMTEVNKWSLESIARIAIDTRLGCLDADLPENSDAMKLIKGMPRFFQLAYELDILPSNWKVEPTPEYIELMGIYDTLTNIAVEHISAAVKRLEKNPTKDETNLSILEKLLKIDYHVALIMALDMFQAGIDTTSSSTVTALYNLAKNTGAQNRLRSEIATVFPKGSPITAEGLNNLPYLKACIKEAQRVKPVSIANGRMAIEDIVLGGYSIPKGTALFTCHHTASVIKNEFPDQEKFLPERWLRSDPNNESTKSVHKFAYLPFGFGPRMCVGKRFAELEMEILVTRMIMDYHLEWVGPDMEYRSSMLTSPTGKMRFKFTPTE